MTASSRRFWSSVSMAVGIFAFWAGDGGLRAQGPPPTAARRFDVASVKPTLSPFELGQQAGRTGTPAPPFMGIRSMPGGRFVASAVTLKLLILRAFGVADYQVVGGPPWLPTDYFDVSATAGGEATQAELNAMLKALLAERFGLRTHSETREAPVHVLTVARADGRLGAGLKPTSPECQKQIDEQNEARKSGTPVRAPALPRGGQMPTTPTCGVMTMMSRANGGSTILMGGMALSSLVSRLTTELEGPVVDRTGLTGLFDVTLEYSSQRTSFNGRAPGLSTDTTDLPPPPIAAAVPQQLGLKLDKQLGPMTVVVIDAASAPTPD